MTCPTYRKRLLARDEGQENGNIMSSTWRQRVRAKDHVHRQPVEHAVDAATVVGRRSNEASRGGRQRGRRALSYYCRAAAAAGSASESRAVGLTTAPSGRGNPRTHAHTRHTRTTDAHGLLQMDGRWSWRWLRRGGARDTPRGNTAVGSIVLPTRPPTPRSRGTCSIVPSSAPPDPPPARALDRPFVPRHPLPPPHADGRHFRAQPLTRAPRSIFPPTCTLSARPDGRPPPLLTRVLTPLRWSCTCVCSAGGGTFTSYTTVRCQNPPLSSPNPCRTRRR